MKHVLLALSLGITSVSFGQSDVASAGKCPMGYDQPGAHGSKEAAHAAAGVKMSHGSHAHQAMGDHPVNIGGRGRTNRDWWHNSLNLSVLRQNSELSNPLGSDFNYRDAFSTLNYSELKADIKKVALVNSLVCLKLPRRRRRKNILRK